MPFVGGCARWVMRNSSTGALWIDRSKRSFSLVFVLTPVDCGQIQPGIRNRCRRSAVGLGRRRWIDWGGIFHSVIHRQIGAFIPSLPTGNPGRCDAPRDAASRSNRTAPPYRKRRRSTQVFRSPCARAPPTQRALSSQCDSPAGAGTRSRRERGRNDHAAGDDAPRGRRTAAPVGRDGAVRGRACARWPRARRAASGPRS